MNAQLTLALTLSIAVHLAALCVQIKHKPDRAALGECSPVIVELWPGDGLCPDWYGGIGVELEEQRVTAVPVGYPAASADLRVGDVMLEGVNQIRGDIGTALTVHFYRDGHPHERQLVRAAICCE